MRKKLLFLAVALAATAASIAAPRAQASLIGGGGPYHSCSICTTYADGSQCCIPCSCDASGNPFVCSDLACAPAPGA